MIKKSLTAMIVLLVLIVGVSGCVDSKNSTNNQTTGNNQVQNNNTTTTNQTNITAAQAQQIATKYIEEPGAVAGTPKLTTNNGKKTYIVPVILNGKTVGGIEIDAQTGANLGEA
ncbi:MAG TPA: peptidase [Methanobacteriaceae archaeon]|nr:peptidase [Methanobacteriaceae archaeon]